MYAHTYYTQEEFDEIYNKKEYDALREKYHATYLPSVYDKVKVDFESEGKRVDGNWWTLFKIWFWSLWPLMGLYGVWKAYWGGDYLLPKAGREHPKHKAKKEL